ncbi:uncharacterized protein LOC144107286 [Amblyomma americanum]
MILDSQYRRADGVSTSESGQDESLYCRTLSVQLKDDFCATARRVSSVCLSIRKSKSSTVGRKELQIQLTDDADPFFVYTLTLTEEDFQSLKAQQGLLVDFLSFPQKFVDLLELCSKDDQKVCVPWFFHFAFLLCFFFASSYKDYYIVSPKPYTSQILLLWVKSSHLLVCLLIYWFINSLRYVLCLGDILEGSRQHSWNKPVKKIKVCHVAMDIKSSDARR